MELDHRQFSVEISESLVLDALSKLGFVSKIKMGEKIDVASLTIVSAHSWGSSAYRTATWGAESRDVSYEFLQKLVDDSVQLVKMYLGEKKEYYQTIGVKLVLGLLECIPGIQNLAKTYHDDRLYVSKLETLIEIIKTKTRDIDNKLLKHGQ